MSRVRTLLAGRGLVESPRWHPWRGMTDPQMVTQGSGQVLVVDVDVPGAGWP